MTTTTLKSPIWDQVLATDEKIVRQFSQSDKYRRFMFWCWFVFGLATLLIGLGLVVMLAAGFYYLFYIPRAYHYALTDRRLLERKGWLGRSTKSITYEKITDVVVKEPFFDRMVLGTGTIVVNTAGTGDEEMTIKYVDDPHAVKKTIDRQVRESD